jgi:hypothetical protein
MVPLGPSLLAALLLSVMAKTTSKKTKNTQTQEINLSKLNHSTDFIKQIGVLVQER